MKNTFTSFTLHNLPSKNNLFNPTVTDKNNPSQTFYIIQFLRTVNNINYITSNHILFSPLYVNSGNELIFYHLVNGLTKHIYSRRLSYFGNARFYQLKLNKNNDIFLSQKDIKNKFIDYYNNIKNYVFNELKNTHDDEEYNFIKNHGISVPDELVYTCD